MNNLMKQAWKLALAVTMVLASITIPQRAFAGDNTGQAIFKSKCASCHGPDGAANTTMGKALKIRDLGSADVQKQSDDELTQLTAKGKGKMPAYDGKLKREQIKEVVGYIRAFRNMK